MGIGLRKQVQIIPHASTADAAGSWKTAEGSPLGVWAEVTDPSGFRVYQGGQTQLGETKNFLIRFRFDRYPNADWTLIYDGRKWVVSEIRKMNEKNFYYRLTATSKSNV